MGNLIKFKWWNDGFRSLFESTLHNDVIKTLIDWKNNYDEDNYVLIGGLAYSYYAKPRYTEDVDLIFMSKNDIPRDVYGFKRTRDHAFQHNKTHVEVEVLDRIFLNQTKEIVDAVFKTAVLSDGIKIASPKSLIVLKLGRYDEQDQADISNLLKHCIRTHIDLNFDIYSLSKPLLKKLNTSINNLKLNEEKSINKSSLEVNYLYENHEYTDLLNETDYKIYLFKTEHAEYPCFYYLNKINRIMKFSDFNFCIKIPDNINEELEVLFSSSNYKSFIGYEREKNQLVKWIKKEGNLKYLKIKYKKLNS